MPPRLPVPSPPDPFALLRTLQTRTDQILHILDVLGPALEDIGELLVLVRNLVPLAESIKASAERIAASSEGIDTHARGIDVNAEVIAREAASIANYLPMLEKSIGVLGPLEGTVQRLGRVVDRLPGGQAATGGRRREISDQHPSQG